MDIGEKEPWESSRSRLFDFSAIADGQPPAHPAGPLLLRWLTEAKGNRIVLADGEDPRAIRAADTVGRLGVHAVLLGSPDRVAAVSREAGVVFSRLVEIVDPLSSPDRARLAKELQQAQAKKGLTHNEVLSLVADPLYFGGMLVRIGEAHGCVAGATRTTGDVLRAAVRTVGLAENVSLCQQPLHHRAPHWSHIWLRGLRDRLVPEPGRAGHHCGIVCPHIRAARFDPSSRGHAILQHKRKRHGRVGARRLQALACAREMAPDLEIDGEFQFDAAWLEHVGRRKAPGSTVPGRANVFIFPNLDAGNIAYKITERLAGGCAFGPILQGLAKPVNDLSRGCGWEDIVAVAAICAAQVTPFPTSSPAPR